jgi:preprotein translocase subunit Sec63
MVQHKKELHSGVFVSCLFNGCTKKFYRKDHLKIHIDKAHGDVIAMMSKEEREEINKKYQNIKMAEYRSSVTEN